MTEIMNLANGTTVVFEDEADRLIEFAPVEMTPRQFEERAAKIEIQPGIPPRMNRKLRRKIAAKERRR